MSTIEKEIKKEEIGSACCSTEKVAAAQTSKETQEKTEQSDKQTKSGCCGG